MSIGLSVRLQKAKRKNIETSISRLLFKIEVSNFNSVTLVFKEAYLIDIFEIKYVVKMTISKQPGFVSGDISKFFISNLCNDEIVNPIDNIENSKAEGK